MIRERRTKSRICLGSYAVAATLSIPFKVMTPPLSKNILPVVTAYRLLWVLVLACLSPLAHARVVINEIMYHAPDDLDDLQYVELHNAGDQPVDLGGWAVKKGVKFKFPPGTRIEPRGFLVICRSAERFKEF